MWTAFLGGASWFGLVVLHRISGGNRLLQQNTTALQS